jgi:hypothetical protein
MAIAKAAHWRRLFLDITLLIRSFYSSLTGFGLNSNRDTIDSMLSPTLDVVASAFGSKSICPVLLASEMSGSFHLLD